MTSYEIKILLKFRNILAGLILPCFLFYPSLALSRGNLHYENSLEDAVKFRREHWGEKNLSTTITDELRYKLLLLAANSGDESLIEMLLANGALKDIDRVSNTMESLTPLMAAIVGNEYKTAVILINAGADVNKIGGDPCSGAYGCENALICAAKHSGPIELLLDRGADVNYQDACGMTALMHAANGFNVFSVETLLSKSRNIDLDKKDKEGRTALMLAAKENCALSVKALIENGAQVNIQDSTGKTALIWSSCDYITWGLYEEREVDIAETLLSNGALVDLPDNSGMTALMYASDRKNLSLIKIFLKYKANPYKKNNNGETAIDIAKKYNKCPECVSILVNHRKIEL